MAILNFIFSYNEYIQNLNEKNSLDDINIYNSSKKEFLIEGLIKTHPNINSLNIIKKRFNELEGTIEPDGEIYLYGEFNEINNYIPLFNNLGYFISKLTLDGYDWLTEFDNTTKPIALFLEPKYDLEISLPKVLYHVSLDINRNKIDKIGLVPKSKNKLAIHPERIYLTDDLNVAKQFGNYLLDSNTNSNIKDYLIYKIDTTDLKIKIYRDLNLVQNGFYTLHNIPKDKLELLNFYNKK